MQKINFVNYLASIKKNRNFGLLPKFLRIRVENAEKQINSITFLKRPISSPTYLNDLGVRKFQSPAMGYKVLKKVCSVGTFSFLIFSPIFV